MELTIVLEFAGTGEAVMNPVGEYLTKYASDQLAPTFVSVVAVVPSKLDNENVAVPNWA
jgi:hypothetical protein